MNSNQRSFLRDAVVVFLLGWLVYGMVQLAPIALRRVGLGSVLAAHPWMSMAMLQVLLVVFSLVAMRLRGGSWFDYGFQRAQNGPWFRTLGGGVLLGAVGTFLTALFGGKGIVSLLIAHGITPIQVLLLVFSASIVEEIFTRGWAQSALQYWRARKLFGLPLPAVVSGLLFGSMHLSLLWRGADRVTATVVLLSVTLLGFWAGYVRDRYASLVPAIGSHMAFNFLGGPIGAILFFIIVRHGKLPGH